MYSVSAEFEAALKKGGVRLCELYQVALANGEIYYYTDHPQDIIWDAAGNRYKAIPIKRGPIRYNADGQADECEITLGIGSLSFLNLVKKQILEAAEITHKRIRWDSSYAADEEMILNIWVADPAFNRSTLQLRLIGLLDSLNIKVPGNMYQEPCNHLLFDPNCSLTRASYAYSGTATAGTATTLTDTTAGTLYKVDFDNGDEANPIERGDTITGQTGGGTGVVVQVVYLTAATGTIWYFEQSGSQFINNEQLQNGGGDSVLCNGVPAEDATFFEQGELEMTSGDNAGHSRPIFSSSAAVRTVFHPFVAAIAAGDGYKIYPGCDFRPQTCWARFANDDNWRGYSWVPPLEETIM